MRCVLPQDVEDALQGPESSPCDEEEGPKLFCFPPECNFSGAHYPATTWTQLAHSRGWHVLWDAAKFAQCNSLDIATCRPDFVAVSFYKMFGFPTSLGALLVHKGTVAVPLVSLSSTH